MSRRLVKRQIAGGGERCSGGRAKQAHAVHAQVHQRQSRRATLLFDEFLAEEGILEECRTAAIKELLASCIEEEMKRQNLTKTAMAARMREHAAEINVSRYAC